MLERVFWLPRRFPRWDGHRASPEVVGRSLRDSKLHKGDRLTRWVICLKMLIGPFGAVEQELSNRSCRTGAAEQEMPDEILKSGGLLGGGQTATRCKQSPRRELPAGRGPEPTEHGLQAEHGVPVGRGFRRG